MTFFSDLNFLYVDILCPIIAIWAVGIVVRAQIRFRRRQHNPQDPTLQIPSAFTIKQAKQFENRVCLMAIFLFPLVGGRLTVHLIWGVQSFYNQSLYLCPPDASVMLLPGCLLGMLAAGLFADLVVPDLLRENYQEWLSQIEVIHVEWFFSGSISIAKLRKRFYVLALVFGILCLVFIALLIRGHTRFTPTAMEETQPFYWRANVHPYKTITKIELIQIRGNFRGYLIHFSDGSYWTSEYGTMWSRAGYYERSVFENLILPRMLHQSSVTVDVITHNPIHGQ